MIKYKLLFLLLMLFFFSAVKSEVIKGPAYFRAEANGKILVSLKDGMEIECGLSEKDWFKVSFSIKITQAQFDHDYKIKKGDKLYDTESKLIGIALADIPVDLTMPSAYGGTIDKPDSFIMEIFGYVSKLSIKGNSIPENVLDSILEKNIVNLQYSALKSFLLRQGYTQEGLLKKNLPTLSQYCVYESTITDPSPGYRIGLYFENNKLIAIEHSRPIAAIKSKEYPILNRNKLFIIKPPIGLTTAAFLKKVNKAYEGAD